MKTYSVLQYVSKVRLRLKLSYYFFYWYSLLTPQAVTWKFSCKSAKSSLAERILQKLSTEALAKRQNANFQLFYHLTQRCLKNCIIKDSCKSRWNVATFQHGSQSLDATEIITEIVILNNNYLSLWLCKRYLDSVPTLSLPPPSPFEVRAVSSACLKEFPCLNSKAQGGKTSKKIIVISFPVWNDESLYPFFTRTEGLSVGILRLKSKALAGTGCLRGGRRKGSEMEYFPQLNRCKLLLILLRIPRKTQPPRKTIRPHFREELIDPATHCSNATFWVDVFQTRSDCSRNWSVALQGPLCHFSHQLIFTWQEF